MDASTADEPCTADERTQITGTRQATATGDSELAGTKFPRMAWPDHGFVDSKKSFVVGSLYPWFGLATIPFDEGEVG